MNFEAQTINRSMNTTIGTAQVSKSVASGTLSRLGYGTKFVSPPLIVTSITAQTWTFVYGIGGTGFTGVGGSDYTWPSTGGSNDHVLVVAYVWRPSTGTKVANIFDGGISVGASGANVTERTAYGTFSGAAVTCQVNDVIIYEMWLGSVSSNNATLHIYYDGTTVTTTTNTVVTDIAAFLQTPQNDIFTIIPEVATVVNLKTYTTTFYRK